MDKSRAKGQRRKQSNSNKKLPKLQEYAARLMSFMRGFGRWHSKKSLWFGIVFPSFFINVLALAFPLALLQTYDRIIPNSATQTLLLLILGVTCAVVLEFILKVLRAIISSWLDARVEYTAGHKILRKIFRVDISSFERRGTGMQMQYINAINNFKDFYGGAALISFLDLIFVFIFLFLIAYIGGYLVFIPMVMTVVLGYMSIKNGENLRNNLDDRRYNDNRRLNFLIENLTGIHTLKSMAMEAQMLRRHERLQVKAADINYNIGLINAHVQSISSVVTQFAIVLVVGFGAMLVISGHLTVGGLAACTLLTGRALQPIAKSISVWNRLQSVKVSEESIAQIYLMPNEFNKKNAKPRRIKGNIRFEDVSFQYPGMEKQLLTSINLQVPAGESIGIRGGDFSGKSTLLALLMRFVLPKSGKIYIDNRDIREYDLANLREQIAYLPQDGVLFTGTILENISNFRPEKEVRAYEIAALLGLDKTMSQLPNGLETEVGTGAVEALPIGIRQLIAMARAFVDEPKIILFDDATAAIDMKAEQVINGVLRDYKKYFTMVLVSNRPSVLALADKVYNLVDGGIEERQRV